VIEGNCNTANNLNTTTKLDQKLDQHQSSSEQKNYTSTTLV